ncbi:unnamed protein product [Dovyalis caffra]|uniref:HMA domain-containing protein n=1 Tax=Dovyalis caffra TaxID=77055 RepID=A0AAV1QTY5_9ROSI|nr:unnamed protein product [Dovyalis caffra]
MEALQNLKGVYSVVLDAEQGTVKVNGKVDPTIILNVFDKYGKHGEVSSVRFDEQQWCGRNQYLMPLPPPLLGPMPQPPRPLSLQQQQKPPPPLPPVIKPPSAPPAPSPLHSKCCTIM